MFAICAANFLNNTADQSLTTKNLKTSFDKNSKNFLLEDYKTEDEEKRSLDHISVSS